jgi:Mannosyl-glycoprotein endo-beta-N-acetylglucosaminidase
MFLTKNQVMKKSIFFISFTIALLFAENIFSNNISIENYILKYNPIAQKESSKSGIPTSIILAQAILESGFGNSRLCRRSNNHFGIKWKKSGDGDFVYSFDDDYDKNGKHVPSKFMKYESASESFSHHSKFLMKKSNYQELFKYKRTDFASWAYGLKACGYSTDKNYGVDLIKLIRRYKLDKYDNVEAIASDYQLVKAAVKLKNEKIQKDPSLALFSKYISTQGQLLENAIENGEVSNVVIIKSDFRDLNDAPVSAPLKENKTPNSSLNSQFILDNRHLSQE